MGCLVKPQPIYPAMALNRLCPGIAKMTPVFRMTGDADRKHDESVHGTVKAAEIKRTLCPVSSFFTGMTL